MGVTGLHLGSNGKSSLIGLPDHGPRGSHATHLSHPLRHRHRREKIIRDFLMEGLDIIDE
jgi:hypothetical protein